MEGPSTEYQDVPKKKYTAQSQLLPPKEGIPASLSSPNLIQNSSPTDWGEDGPPSPQPTSHKRASSVPRPAETPPAPDMRVDLEGAKLERFREWLHCIIIGTDSNIFWMPSLLYNKLSSKL